MGSNVDSLAACFMESDDIKLCISASAAVMIIKNLTYYNAINKRGQRSNSHTNILQALHVNTIMGE